MASHIHLSQFSIVFFLRVLLVEDTVRLIPQVHAPETIVQISAVKKKVRITAILGVVAKKDVAGIHDIYCFIAQLVFFAEKRVHSIREMTASRGV